VYGTVFLTPIPCRSTSRELQSRLCGQYSVPRHSPDSLTLISLTLGCLTLDNVTLDNVTLDNVTLDNVTLDNVTLDNVTLGCLTLDFLDSTVFLIRAISI